MRPLIMVRIPLQTGGNGAGAGMIAGKQGGVNMARFMATDRTGPVAYAARWAKRRQTSPRPGAKRKTTPKTVVATSTIAGPEAMLT